MSTCLYATISEMTIGEILESTSKMIERQYGEEGMMAAYCFASDLCGRSIDALVSQEDLAEDDVFSEDDVVETIDAIQHGFDREYSENEMDAIYAFASELTGKSIDSLFEESYED